MSGYSLNDKRTERGARTFESEGRATSRFHRPENSAESLPTVNINSSSNGLSWTAPLSHFLFVSCCCCLFFVLFCLFVFATGGSRYLGGSASTLDPCIRALGSTSQISLRFLWTTQLNWTNRRPIQILWPSGDGGVLKIGRLSVALRPVSK